MDFDLSDDHLALRDTLRRFLATRWGEAAVRAWADGTSPFDPDLWRQMCTQLGLAGLAVPEQYGGSGCGAVEQVVVLEEMGRVLFGGPYFSSVVLGTGALLACAGEAERAELLPRLVSGDLTATLALADTPDTWTPAQITMTARQDPDGGWVLDGAKHLVVDGASADLVLVAARTPGGLSLFGVEGAAPSLTRTTLPTMDATRRLATLTLASTPARLLGPEGQAEQGLTEVLDLAAIALAAEQVGGAARCLELCVTHARTREQFGRPIGSFQAVKHRCADMRVREDAARAAVHYASWATAEGTDDAALLTDVVKTYCSDAFVKTAGDTIQVHGGIGFTWEHPAHLYLKRAKSSQLFLGSPGRRRARIAQALFS